MATYSIVARDGSGALGVAVQSHWFNVGAVVPWVEAGVGAVAVQSIPDPSHGPRALALLREGLAPADVLARLIGEDPQAAYRQIGIVDASGRAAAHTGELCIAEAGHETGDGVTVQANLMERPTVWPAMLRAFEGTGGDLAERLLRALEAAEAEGGDVRGRQSAAIVVRPAPGSDGPDLDLRVEDHPDPVGELRRLVLLGRAYHELNRGDALIAAGDVDGASAAYARATGLVPDGATGGEAPFWAGVALAGAGRLDEALPYLRRAAAVDGRWAGMLDRLARSRLLPDDPGLLERLRRAMEAP
ncbi:MAG TPA: DUF1028 domain-containing protein [Actinomycetota bacterium]|nr:DUF1028 domain-containing protein [Actinomycetota bacterium]